MGERDYKMKRIRIFFGGGNEKKIKMKKKKKRKFSKLDIKINN